MGLVGSFYAPMKVKSISGLFGPTIGLRYHPHPGRHYVEKRRCLWLVVGG
jgi:hypothetical protein